MFIVVALLPLATALPLPGDPTLPRVQTGPNHLLAPGLPEDRGPHPVAEASSAGGGEASTAGAGEIALLFRCDGALPLPWNSMESGSMPLPGEVPAQPSCWGHLGHMTFFVEEASTSLTAPNTIYAFRGASGRVQAVETGEDVAGVEGLSANPLAWALPVEVSVDGRAWDRVGTILQPLACQPLASCFITFNLVGQGEPFRFFRVSKPPSALEGLQGYLDSATITVRAEAVATFPAAVPEPGERSFACDHDLFEDYFDAHPCWFGPAFRQNAASLIHTYHVNESYLDRVEGRVTVLPFRPEDEDCFLRFAEEPRCGPLADPALPPGYPIDRILRTTNTTVELSEDGVNWTEVHRFPTRWAEDTEFETPDLGGVHARFVRFHTQKHPCFDAVDNPCHDEPLRHFEGSMFDSRFTVVGDVTDPGP